MKELSKAYNPKEVEEKIYSSWEKNGYFTPDKLKRLGTRKQGLGTFTIVIPPPNITGSLHMGHALNATLQDILVRKKRMEGYRTLWLPGIDHAGIATQNVVEKELRKEGLTRYQLGREKFLERVWQWKEKYGSVILDQLKKLGASMDWSRTRFTMDEQYQEAVKQAFIHYYNRGWIYRGERAVNWCSRCGTSLSDLEIEYQEEEAIMYYIKYGPLTIATVRPETKLGDTAVAVNPKDERYKKYIGKVIEIETVLGPAKMRVIADPSVDMKFGTGAMKVTPAHDMHDFELSEKYGLEKKQVIGPDGRMTALAGKYQGMKVLEARKQIVEDMRAKGILVKTEPYKHNVAVCYRCGTVLEPLLSKQWFLKMSELAKKAIKAVKSGKVKFHPKRWEKIYFDWLKNVKDWCISRQIWWGHRIPVWHATKVGSEMEAVYFKKEILYKKLNIKNDNEFDAFSDNFFIEGKKIVWAPSDDQMGLNRVYINLLKDNGFIDEAWIQNSKIERRKGVSRIFVGEKPPEPLGWVQESDVLDTWFSSALWPFATLGWPSKKVKDQRLKIKGDLETFYPTQVLSTDRGIINLWVARMIFSGLEFMGKEPFRDVIIHATILTREGQRMSKSKGTGVDPLDLIDKYGADATRFGIIWQTMGTQDVRWSEEHVLAGKKFANKIWNASRFVLQQIGISKQIQNPLPTGDLSKGDKSKNLTNADKEILKKFAQTKKEVSRRIDKYEFGQALHILYDFFWHKFCDSYLEESKKQLTTDNQQQTTSEILFYVLLESLKLLHPFMPFITEAIYGELPEFPLKKKSLMIEEWEQ